MKATYTRKKPQSPLNPADRVNRTSAHVEALSDQENNGVADDDTGHDSMDVAPRSRIGSGIPSEDNSRMLGEDTSVSLNNSALVANVVNTQLQQESANTDEEMSDEENELYEVEYFMADDYKMVLPRWRILRLFPLVSSNITKKLTDFNTVNSFLGQTSPKKPF